MTTSFRSGEYILYEVFFRTAFQRNLTWILFESLIPVKSCFFDHKHKGNPYMSQFHANDFRHKLPQYYDS